MAAIALDVVATVDDVATDIAAGGDEEEVMVTAVGDEDDWEFGANAGGCVAATLVLAPWKAGVLTDVITAAGLKATGIEGEADGATADEGSCKEMNVLQSEVRGGS